MTAAPRVSVVTIFLDAERFLREAIESVLAQTYRSWELLLVDDGSTDGSADIAQAYAREHPHVIRYLQHPGGENRGMSASRNLGIGAAAGELVAFLDADDVYLPEKLARQSELLDAHPGAAMVYGPTLHWHSWSGLEATEPDRQHKLGVAPDSLVQPPELVRRFLAGEGWPPGTCGALVRRSAIERVGGFEERFRGLFEDQAFFYKLCLRFPVYVHRWGWDLYRQHPDSACQRARTRGEWHPRRPNPAHRKFVFWLESYFVAKRIEDPELWRSLRARLLPYRRPVLWRVKGVAALARNVMRPLGQ
jgi:glycosyltransferase involved in cell wall biosynthesis